MDNKTKITIDPEVEDNNVANKSKVLTKQWDYWAELSDNLSKTDESIEEYLESLWEWKKVWMDIADRLIRKWKWSYLIANLNKFEEKYYKTIVKKIFEKWSLKVLAKNLNKFKWLDTDEIAGWIFQRRFNGNINNISKHMEELKWLEGNWMVSELMEWDLWTIDAIIYKFRKLSGFDKAIARKLMENGLWAYVAMNIGMEPFEKLDYNEIAKELIKMWYWADVSRNLNYFHNLDYEVADWLIKNREEEHVIMCIDSFGSKYRKKIAEELLKQWWGDEIAKRIRKYEWILDKSTLNSLKSTCNGEIDDCEDDYEDSYEERLNGYEDPYDPYEVIDKTWWMTQYEFDRWIEGRGGQEFLDYMKCCLGEGEYSKYFGEYDRSLCVDDE